VIGSGNQARIYGDFLFATETMEFLLLNKSKQGYLNFFIDGADFIQQFQLFIIYGLFGIVI